jgi:hypothetical protein
MEHLSQTEKTIISAILADAISAGYTISVYDGEEWAVKLATSVEAAAREIGATDCTTLRFRKHGESVGQVFLVHGNDCDVIADHTDNAAMESLLARANQIAESFL